MENPVKQNKPNGRTQNSTKNRNVLPTQTLGIKNEELSKKIVLPTETGKIFKIVEQIVSCNTIGRYCEVCFNNKEKILVNYSLKQMEELLPQTYFFRIHTSCILNLTIIKNVDDINNEIITECGCSVKIARRRKTEFIKRLNDLHLYL